MEVISQQYALDKDTVRCRNVNLKVYCWIKICSFLTAITLSLYNIYVYMYIYSTKILLNFITLDITSAQESNAMEQSNFNKNISTNYTYIYGSTGLCSLDIAGNSIHSRGHFHSFWLINSLRH